MKNFMIVSIILLAGCGSDNTAPLLSTNANLTAGQFIDSAVKGLTYASVSANGVTDINGNFTCKDGEVVTFKINNAAIGSSVCKNKITPYELMDESPLSSTKSKRMVKMFMSLDADEDVSNGIDISSADLSSYSTVDFSDDTDYQNILSDNSKADVGDAAATTHMQTYMNKVHTKYDGTYSGVMEVSSGSCGAYTLTVTVLNAQVAQFKLEANGETYTQVTHYSNINEQLNFYTSVSGIIDWGTRDDSYCDARGGSAMEGIRISGGSIASDENGLYFAATKTDTTWCNNSDATNHCVFTGKLYKQ